MAVEVRDEWGEREDRAGELARLLADAHEQLAARDAELSRLRDALLGLQRDYRALAASYAQVQETRAWRAVVRYRAVRERILGA